MGFLMSFIKIKDYPQHRQVCLTMPHSFRKGFATQLENAGQQHNISARLMGHELGDQTFGGYSDGVMFERLVKAISHINWKNI